MSQISNQSQRSSQGHNKRSTGSSNDASQGSNDEYASAKEDDRQQFNASLNESLNLIDSTNVGTSSSFIYTHLVDQTISSDSDSDSESDE